MGGIAGIAYPDVFHITHQITPMLRSLRHTGEDAYGSLVFKHLEVGTCGRPMGCNQKKTIYCGLSGFLDNAQELAQTLSNEGYTCSTGSHEELIICAYELWGIGCLKKIRGSFAVMILDRVQEQLLLARDSTGKKNLYWFQDSHYFLFASELKSLMVTGLVPQTPAPDAIAAYLYFGYVPQDMTPIQHVSKLLPGHYLLFTKNHSKYIEPYWSYSSFFEEKAVAHRPTIVKTIDQMLTHAVQSHVVPNIPIGCFITGGIGSACVADYLHKSVAPDLLEGFSSCFEGENNEDLHIAEEVASSLHMKHEKVILTPKNFLNDFVKIIWHLDEPLADPTVIGTWELSKEAAKHCMIVFSGMGSDELFAGHARYVTNEQSQNPLTQAKEMALPFLNYWLTPLFNYFYKPAAYSLLRAATSKEWQVDYLNRNALLEIEELAKASPKLAYLFDPQVFVHKFHNISRIKTSTASFLYFDVKTRLPDLYMMQYDKLTAAHNLIWYSPFLDRNLVEYAASLPEPTMLLEKDTASYLKKLMETRLPSSVLTRPKRTRPNFLQGWLEHSELPQIFQKLRTGILVETGIISEAWLDSKLKTVEDQKNNFTHLWAILTLEVWFRLFINHPVHDSPPDIHLKDLLAEK